MKHGIAALLVAVLVTPAWASTTFVPPPAPASVAQGKFVFESIRTKRKDPKALTDVERQSLALYVKSLKS